MSDETSRTRSEQWITVEREDPSSVLLTLTNAAGESVVIALDRAETKAVVSALRLASKTRVNVSFEIGVE